MKKVKEKHCQSKMMDELSQLKVYGGRDVSAEKFKLSMKNCRTICRPTSTEE